jgi:hypothetical protein
MYSTSYEDGVLMAVNLGDDADTIAAIYGYLAGAFYGVQGIPSRWIDGIAMRPLVDAVAHQLYHHTTSTTNDNGNDKPQQLVSYQWIMQQLEYLERVYGDIKRKTLPGPHRYTSLTAFDEDVKQLRHGHTLLVPPSSTSSSINDTGLAAAYNLLPEFERRAAVDRRAMALLLERPKMGAALFGIGGIGIGGLKLKSTAKTASAPTPTPATATAPAASSATNHTTT